VCHQTVSLVARHLEANGIPTVTIACARDIVEHCGVSRLVFTDFPLGNPCGRPFDETMQRGIVETALELLETATEPRTTVQSPFVWSEDETWKEKIFTREQPFLEGEAYERWIKGKEMYRKLKSEGKV
jgi:D-proline reductase (dithiol) PrdB